MKKKNGKKSPVASTRKAFDLSALVPEDNVAITPKSEGTVEMYEKLNELQVGQSFRMPMELYRIYCNAKTTHKRLNKKIFISRKLDKYNFRCWRLADGTVLARPRQTQKKKK